MSQTAVASKMTAGLAGQLFSLGDAADARLGSATSAESSAEIGFGLMVIRGSADGSALLPHTSAAAMVAAPLLLGVVVLSHGFAEPQELADTDSGGLKPKTTFTVLEEGEIWVIPEDNVTPASDVRVRVVAAGAEKAGAFRAAADSTDCVEISAFARWRSSASGGSPARLWIDMSNVQLAVADT